MQIYFDTFPDMKVVTLTRSPIDLVHDWYIRNTMDRWGQDPTFFNIPLQGKKGVIPWYMYPYAKKYESLTVIDRTIFLIETLFGRYEKAIRALSHKNRKKILFVSYEDILADTYGVIKRMQKFLGKKPLPDMAKILKREHLPNPDYAKNKREKRLADIKKDASPEYFNRLLALEKKYYAN